MEHAPHKKRTAPLDAATRARLNHALDATTLDALSAESGLSVASIRRAARGEPLTQATARLIGYALVARTTPSNTTASAQSAA